MSMRKMSKNNKKFPKMVAKHNVIVVRVNYRLGPFGWFTHPSIQELQTLYKTQSWEGCLPLTT